MAFVDTTNSSTGSVRSGARTPASSDEDALVRAHLPLVGYLVSEAASRLPRHVCRDDLISAGMAVLAEAARSFDPSRGVRFSAFASTRIRGAIVDELRRQDWASRSVRARSRQREQAVDELSVRLGRVPTKTELAERMGVEAKALDAMDDDVHRAVVLSFQALIDGDAADHLVPGSGPTPDELLLERERQAYLRDAIAELPERLRTVVVQYFFAERPMAEIAGALGVTESRVSQLRAEALVLLRNGLNTALDPEAVPAESRPTGVAARRKESYYAAIAARSDYHTRLSVPTQREPSGVSAYGVA